MQIDQVRKVRRFNRTVTQRVGALDQSYLDRGRPLGEARIIYEIGRAGIDLRVLREKLALDSGYLSRLLRSLERQGLVEMRSTARDRRTRRVTLTPRGVAELEAYDAQSDALATSLLEPLDAERRARLVAAMAEVEQLIHAGEIEIRVEPPDGPDATACLDAYLKELADRFEDGFDPTIPHAARPEQLTPPAGYFMVARLHGRVAGCGALKLVGDGIAELKRMWTADFARGQGVARNLLETIEAKARALGIHTLRLETNKALIEAHALYRAAGFREVPPFNEEPYAHHWFAKQL
jgi:DNA-binding MarR family transcriptional regulator/N-acetylglutamate synthase-like GNAT family acetyltransferase